MTPPLPLNFHLQPAHVRQTARLLAACGATGGIAALLSLPEWYWALITVVTVMQADLSHTLSAARNRMAGTLIGAAMGLLLILLRGQGLPGLPLFVVGLVPLAVLTAIQPTMRLSCTTLIVVFLIPGAADPYSRALFRVLDILLGSLTCAAVSVLIPPPAPQPGRQTKG